MQNQNPFLLILLVVSLELLFIDRALQSAFLNKVSIKHDGLQELPKIRYE
jgi:hypothetical protein